MHVLAFELVSCVCFEEKPTGPPIWGLPQNVVGFYIRSLWDRGRGCWVGVLGSWNREALFRQEYNTPQEGIVPLNACKRWVVVLQRRWHKGTMLIYGVPGSIQSKPN